MGLYRMTSKQIFACLLPLTLIFGESALGAPQAKIEDCGWLVPSGNSLVDQPDALLKPSDPAPKQLMRDEQSTTYFADGTTKAGGAESGPWGKTVGATRSLRFRVQGDTLAFRIAIRVVPFFNKPRAAVRDWRQRVTRRLTAKNGR
jgi:hypothetical protein